jgi:hypothetical protein
MQITERKLDVWMCPTFSLILVLNIIPLPLSLYTGVPGGKISILGGHSIAHSKQKSVYTHVSYSERFPR